MTSYIPPKAAPVSELRAWFLLAIMNLRLHLIYAGLKPTVGHDDCVILSTKVCLYALAGRTAPRILALRILLWDKTNKTITSRRCVYQPCHLRRN